MWNKIKALWNKVKTWWLNSKIRPIWIKIGKAIRQFLRWAYAAQISFLVLALLFYLWISRFVGALLLIWGVILLIAEFRQKKADSQVLPTTKL